MQKSDQINELATALALSQGEFKDPEKSTQAHRYKYADLAAVLEASRHILSKNGLSIVQMVEDRENGNVAVETMLMHKSGQFISTTSSMPVEPKNGSSRAQQAGMVITYLRRYCYAAMVGISQADEDAALPQQSNNQPQYNAAPPPPPAPPPPSHPPPIKKEVENLIQEIGKIESKPGLDEWATDNTDKLNKLPDDLKAEVKNVYADRLREFKANNEKESKAEKDTEAPAVITENQRKYLEVLVGETADANGVRKQDFRNHLKSVIKSQFDVESFKNLTYDQFSLVVNGIGQSGKDFIEQMRKPGKSKEKGRELQYTSAADAEPSYV